MYQHNMQIHIILSNFKFVTLMEQNMVVLPEHMVSHTMFEFCHGFCSFCVFYLIMSVLLSWSPFFSKIFYWQGLFLLSSPIANFCFIVTTRLILERRAGQL